MSDSINHEAILNYVNEAAEAMRAGQSDSALMQLTRAFSLAHDSENARLTAYVLTALGHAYLQTGNAQRAVECFTSALTSAAEHPDLALTATAGLARASQTCGDHAAAITHFEDAAKLAEAADNRIMATSLRADLAELLLTQGKPKDALKVYQQVAEAARALKRADFEASALVGSARATHEIDPGSAPAAINKALMALRGVSNAETQKSLRAPLRALMLAIGESEMAILNEFDLIDAWAANDQGRVLDITIRRAEKQLEAGTIDAATETLNHARGMAQDTGNKAAEARIVGLIAQTHEQSGFAYMALGLYEEQAALAGEARNRELEIAALRNLATAHDRNGQPAKGIDALQKAIMLAKVKVDASLEAGLVFDQAQLQTKMGDAAAALELLERAKKLLASGANPALLNEVEAAINAQRGPRSGSMASRFK